MTCRSIRFFSTVSLATLRSTRPMVFIPRLKALTSLSHESCPVSKHGWARFGQVDRNLKRCALFYVRLRFLYVLSYNNCSRRFVTTSLFLLCGGSNDASFVHR